MTERPQENERALVSLLIVARNAEKFIGEALISASRQAYEHLDILVVDDRSTDATASIVRRHAARDPRIRLETGDGEGLSAVRNKSLDLARGRFAAILDSDDILHPRHVETLVREIRTSGATFVSANMIVFSRGPRPTARPFATHSEFAAPRALTRLDFMHGGNAASGHPSYGTLKPMMDLHRLRKQAIRYDTSLRIGEDFDFVDQAMLAGASYRLVPEQTYFYRKHAGSVSHRMPKEDLLALIAAARGSKDPTIDAASSARVETLEAMVAHSDAVTALKQGDIGSALKAIAARPQVAHALAASSAEGLKRRLGRIRPSAEENLARSDRVALFLGSACTSQAAQLASRLRARSWTVRERAPSNVQSAGDLSTLTSHVDLIVLLDDSAAEFVPFVLAPRARVIDLRSCKSQQHPNERLPAEEHAPASSTAR